jgi:hypothetical protein
MQRLYEFESSFVGASNFYTLSPAATFARCARAVFWRSSQGKLRDSIPKSARFAVGAPNIMIGRGAACRSD